MRSSSRCSAREVNMRYGSRHAPRHEVVDEDADVRLLAAKKNRRAIPPPLARVEAPAIRPCAAASSYPDVPLICPAEEQARQAMRFQRGLQLGWIEVVLRRHPGTAASLASARDPAAPARRLPVARRAGRLHREAVHVDLVDVHPLRARERSDAAPGRGNACTLSSSDGQ